MQQHQRYLLIYSMLSFFFVKIWTHNVAITALRSSSRDLCPDICCSLLWQCFHLHCCLLPSSQGHEQVRLTYHDVLYPILHPRSHLFYRPSLLFTLDLAPDMPVHIDLALYTLLFLEIHGDVLPTIC